VPPAVRRELNAVELEIEHLGERADEERLGEARDADDQAVAADEQRQQHLIDDIALADDELGQLFFDALAAGIHLVGERDVFRRIHHGRLV
jgi:hypothetical protein